MKNAYLVLIVKKYKSYFIKKYKSSFVRKKYRFDFN